MNGEVQGMKGNSAVGIDRSCAPEAEDIIEDLVGFGDNNGPEKLRFSRRASSNLTCGISLVVE